MNYKVVWSDFAELQLDEIFKYYLENASLLVAQNLIEAIILEPNKLLKNPEIAQKEDLLANRNDNYRYIICKSYKIIFSIDNNLKMIKVADVFDTRQNPTKMKRVK